MRKIGLLIVAVLLTAAPVVSAGGGEEWQVDWWVWNPCQGGHWIHITGTAHYEVKTHFDQNGGEHVNSNYRLSHVTAVDEAGIPYHVQDKSHYVENYRSENGHQVISFRHMFKAVAAHDLGYMNVFAFHYTFVDGQLVSEKFEYSYCQ